jgi:hypothetical protein
VQPIGETDLDSTSTQAASPEPEAMSAGQASLAQLGDREEIEADQPRIRERPTGKVAVGAWMVVAGALALIIGSTMSWMHVRPARVGDPTTASGMDLGDGRITVALAIVLVVLAAGMLTGRLQRIGGTKVAAMGVLVAGAAAVAVTAVDMADVAARAARLGVPADAGTSIGRGLWLCFVGGLLAVGGGLLVFANRERTPRI